MTKVFVAQHPTEAHFVKALLESRGISSEVRGESRFGLRGQIPFEDTFPEIWLYNDDQAGEALEILGKLSTTSASRAGTDQGEPWKCSKCGETIEAQFSNCWKCNADKPTAQS